MDRSDLRDVLLGLLNDETVVDEFLNRVDETNEVAMTRIARATTTVTSEQVVETTEETKTEVVEELQEQPEVKTETKTDEIVFTLDENFIPDLVGSEEFRTALNSVLESALNGLRNEFEERFRSLQARVEEQEEVIQDVPARQKRAVVGYRPTTVATEDVPVENRRRTYEEIAKETISTIFDN